MEEIGDGFVGLTKIVFGEALEKIDVGVVILDFRYLFEVLQCLLKAIQLQIHFASSFVNALVVTLVLKY